MRTLYVSDLDGTLLRSDETVSSYTCGVINALVERGMLFSFATARSLVTTRKVTRGIGVRLPLIVYNGAFVMDSATGEILIENRMDGAQEVLCDLFSRGVYPIVYAFIDGIEKFSFVPRLCTPGMRAFLETRRGDIRWNEVDSPDELRRGSIFYIVCIGEPDKLAPLHDTYKDRYHCVYHVDIYTRAQWLEIMPRGASKSSAARKLMDMLNCGRLVAFGDALNDIDLFELADEGYAVANAHENLKRLAAGVIASNDEDGVARWLEENWKDGEK